MIVQSAISHRPNGSSKEYGIGSKSGDDPTPSFGLRADS